MSTRRDLERGYAVDLKRVVLAYVAETVIVIASLIGAYLFAEQYGHHDPATMLMMMLAPAAYAVVEFCRVPLAISIRTQTSLLLRLFAVLGVLGAGCVTIKSMSQLGEIMFRPRLYDVVHARERLDDARAAAASMQQTISEADDVVAQRRAELRNAEQQLGVSTEKLGNLPEQKCLPISGISKDGRAWRSMKCSADQRIAPLVRSVANATTDRVAASDRLDRAGSERDTLSRASTDMALRTEQLAYREAVMNSQLHSFAAMVFGKQPTEVTDGEIHQFLRFFIFIPAIGSAFAATLIALMAVQRLPVVPPVDLVDDAGAYILEPFAGAVVRQAVEAATKAARESVERPIFTHA
ncbi:hypothetical protein [Rhodopila sp.]|uniref:hypothetical protein n=1 Tax=Rhodopila sp. TaxID=2480087 RepID=UPI003D11A84F